LGNSRNGLPDLELGHLHLQTGSPTAVPASHRLPNFHVHQDGVLQVCHPAVHRPSYVDHLVFLSASRADYLCLVAVRAGLPRRGLCDELPVRHRERVLEEPEHERRQLHLGFWDGDCQRDDRQRDCDWDRGRLINRLGRGIDDGHDGGDDE